MVIEMHYDNPNRVEGMVYALEKVLTLSFSTCTVCERENARKGGNINHHRLCYHNGNRVPAGMVELSGS